MKIFKISSRQDWQIYIEEFKNELKEKDISKKEKNTRNKFFNYIKAENIKTIFFHGTSEVLYQKMKENGYMMSPEDLNTKQYEKRNEGLDKIFFTKNIIDDGGADFYKRRAEEQTNSKGILLVLDIPIYRISEIQAAIFNSYTYNEGRGFKYIKEIVDENMPDLIRNFDKYKNYLINQILKIVNDRDNPEFTVYGKIKVNSTKSGFQYIKKADEIKDKQWYQWVEKGKVSPIDLKEQVTDENQWIQWVEEGEVKLIDVKEQITDENQWIQWVEEGKVSPINVKEKITDVNQWIQWVEEGKVKQIDLLFIPKKIEEQITIKQWIQFVENNKTAPKLLPIKIQQQITDENQWIKWVENNKVDPIDIPREIQQQIKVNQWIQWIKKNKINNPIHIPIKIKKQITDVNLWIQLVENDKIYPMYIPENIRQQITDENQWIKWIEENKIYLKDISENIKQQITDVNLWIKWVENKKMPPIDLPEKIKKQIELNQWIEWIKNKNIEIKIDDAPDHIKEKINQQKQSMNWFKFIKRNIK